MHVSVLKTLISRQLWTNYTGIYGDTPTMSTFINSLSDTEEQVRVEKL